MLLVIISWGPFMYAISHMFGSCVGLGVENCDCNIMLIWKERKKNHKTCSFVLTITHQMQENG